MTKPGVPTDAVDFTLRPYRASDFDRLWQIDQMCFPPGIAYSQMELSGFIMRRNAIVIVAEFLAAVAPDDPIAGYAIAQPYKKYGRIITLDILPEARRYGLGSRLMSECEDRLRQRGCTEIYLEAAVDNHAALKLYHKLGYQTLRTLPEYYHAHRLDAFLLAKKL